MKQSALSELLRYRQILKETEPQLLRNRDDPVVYISALGTSMLSSHRRCEAMLAYFLDRDLTSFRRLLLEAVELKVSLLRRFKNGEPIGDSYLSLINTNEVFVALALGEREIAREFAESLITHEKMSREHIPKRYIALGMCLCSFVLDDSTNMQKWSVKCAEKSAPHSAYYAALSEVFLAILQRSDVAVNQGLEKVTKSHRKQCGSDRLFGKEEKELSLWGVGIANLARWAGIQADPLPPLIPQELLVAISDQSASAG